MSSRRKSTINLGRATRKEQDFDGSDALELERLEQKTTLVLQEIDQNLLLANAVINDKMFPVLKKYAASTSKVWENVGFWKHFMEEAADVEVKTSNDMLESQKNTRNDLLKENVDDGKDAVEKTTPIESEDSNLLGQIQASTPQQPRSRALLLSTQSENTPRHTLFRSSSVQLRLPHSLDKTTPMTHQSETEARRLSVILRHLNSSPTFPESPVLRTEIRRLTTGSISSAVNPPRTEQRLTSSDSDSLDLGRLLPVLLPSITLTPKAQNAPLSQERPTQRFPNTPNFGSSSLRATADRQSLASPVQRGHKTISALLPDAPDIPVPKSLAIPQLRDDESDEIAAPQLLSLQPPSAKRERSGEDSRAPKKRKVVDDDHENVFLDQNSVSRNNSTIYHTMAQESPKETGSMIESNSRSMSQIFERVLLAGPSEPNTQGTIREETIPENVQSKTASEQRDVPEPQSAPQGDETAPKASARSELTENLSQAAHSFDSTANSSGMDSFFREKWKSLTSNLK